MRPTAKPGLARCRFDKMCAMQADFSGSAEEGGIKHAIQLTDAAVLNPVSIVRLSIEAPYTSMPITPWRSPCAEHIAASSMAQFECCSQCCISNGIVQVWTTLCTPQCNCSLCDRNVFWACRWPTSMVWPRPSQTWEARSMKTPE